MIITAKIITVPDSIKIQTFSLMTSWALTCSQHYIMSSNMIYQKKTNWKKMKKEISNNLFYKSNIINHISYLKLTFPAM